MLLILVFVCFLVNTQEVYDRKITISHSNELETVLCNSGPLSNDTIIVLSTNITHEITNISFCLVNTSHSLTIKSATNSLAHIRCPTAISQPSYPTSGFVFVNLYNLTLQKLSFQECGAFLRDLDESILSSINSTTSPVHFTEYQSSLLLFLHIETLLIKDINMLSNYGFAVLTINPLSATIENVNVTSTKSAEFYTHKNMSLGNGVLILFTDESNLTPSLNNHRVLIKKSRFSYNIDYIKSNKCLSDLSDVIKLTSIPVINAAGLTILYTQQNFSANVQISLTTFTRNTGSYSDAMLVLHFNSIANVNSQTVIDYGSFIENYDLFKCHGAALVFIMIFYKRHHTHLSNDFPLNVSNSVFRNQNDPFGFNEIANAGAISIFIHNPPLNKDFNITVTFSNVNFTDNLIETTGSCLYATTYSYENSALKPLIVILKNVIAYKNSQRSLSTSLSKAGMFTMVNVKFLYLTGFNSCYHDNSGSVFEVIDTSIILDGNMLFEGNRGERGAVFKLYGSSTFYLNNGLRATFINNIAHRKGGAIFAQDDTHEIIKQCTFQFLYPLQNISALNISMIFINNTAGLSGSSIFSTNLYNCYMHRNYYHNIYSTIFHFHSLKHSQLNISTLSISRCICIQYSCLTIPNKIISAYPGQTLHIPVAAKDVVGNNVYAAVSLALARTKGGYGNLPLSPLSSWSISPHDENQVLLESQQCTLVNFTLYQRIINQKGINNAVFVVSSHDDSSLLKVKLKLLDCPIGLKLNTIKGTCQCSPIIDKLGLAGDYQPTCQVVSDNSNSQFPLATITRPPTSAAWAGLMNITNGTSQTTVFGVALTCHESCSLVQGYTMFLINGSDVLIADPNNYLVNRLPLCPPRKTGPLCSTCTTVNGIKYSVVFGSSECKQCSNWWLLTLTLYAVAGPFLIYLLFALRLTITTGTLNGIIFYAQIIGILNIKIISTQPVVSLLHLAMNVFISMLNLSLGIPLCLYNGMTELWKAGLSLLFPFYLLTIVVLLIILSHFSLKISNRIAHSSVQVLVTVVHLSFTSLLTAITDVYTPINIYINDTNNSILKVWYRDGIVEYGKGGHLILMILTFLIVGPVLLSYMTILVAGRPLMKVGKLREYIRPVYEAIHGPYKHNKEFFFTTRLLLIVLLYTLSTLFRTGDIYKGFAIAIPIIAIYLTIEAFCKPFRKMWLNIFNLFIIWNYLILCCSSWYFSLINNINQTALFSTTITIVIFLAFVIVATSHILWVTGKMAKIKPKLHIFQLKMTSFFRCDKTYDRHSQGAQNYNYEGSFFDTCDDLREPLLSST